MKGAIERKEYLDKLKSLQGKEVIKVISGIRRCGKSTLFTLFQQYLLENNIEKEQIIHINFEDLANEPLLDYKLLYEHITSLLPSAESKNAEKMHYVFLDEIQHVDKFEKVVDSLFIKKNVDVYITGSNAYFMSGELATLLSGRYVEIKMLPLSFKEFYDAHSIKPSLQEVYNKYITNSSFPYTLQLDDDKTIKDYLEGLYNTIILNDVVARYRISDVKMFHSVVKFIFSNVGNRLSVARIANAMTSGGRKIDNKTVEKYLQGLLDTLVLYEANRYNIKGKQVLKLEEKYYLADLGLRYILTGGKDTDVGHILENVIYLELLRRGYTVYVGQIEKNEVDFVASKMDEEIYIQVSASVRDPKTLERELASLQMITDNYPKLLLSLDEDPPADYNGIKRLNALKWLLDK